MKKLRIVGCAIALATFSLFLSNSYSATPLRAAADAHVSWGNINSNFGASQGVLFNTWFSTTNEVNKGYFLFDASVFGTNMVSQVTGISFLNNISRTYVFHLVRGANTSTGINADDWIESGVGGITWANAPGNNWTNLLYREFNAYPGETVTNLGSVGASANVLSTLAIASGSGAELELLEALNAGDRKATVAVYLNRTSVNGVMRSREQDDGDNAVSINVELPPTTPAGILRQPRPVTVTSGPYRKATFKVEAFGGGTVTYQWLTNGVEVTGATTATLELSNLTNSALNGTLVSVRIDNDYTVDPGIVSSSALLTIVDPPTPDAVILANSDICIYLNTLYNSYTDPGNSQINFALAATGATDLTGTNRSYMGFTLGTQPVASAKVKLYQHWGGAAVNGIGLQARGTFRIYGSTNNIALTEPADGAAIDPLTFPDYGNLDNTNFTRADAGQITVGPDLGWYELNITGFYNSNLGKQTILRLSGATTAGFDYPTFEDRENTVYNAGAGGSWPNSGPRIELVYPSPQITGGSVSGSQVTLGGAAAKYPLATFHVLASPSLGTAPSSWTSVATNQVDADGNFSVSFPYNSGESQKFYVIQVQVP